MKPFVINSNGISRTLRVPVQFMRFGVDDQEIIVPIRKHGKTEGKERPAESPATPEINPGSPMCKS